MPKVHYPRAALAFRICKEFFWGAGVPAANIAAELHRRDAYNSTEDLREMTLIREADRFSCAGQRDFRITQVLLRTFDSAHQNVLVRGQACACLE